MIDLKNFREQFEKERAVIEYAKCMYGNFGYLGSFEVDGLYVYVEEKGNGYLLKYDSQAVMVKCENRMITYYEIL